MHFVILLFLFLFSCSDDLKYNKGAEPISVKSLTESQTVFVGELVEFRSEINPSFEDVKRLYWLINSIKCNKCPSMAFDTAFTKCGIYEATFNVVDYFDDTLSTDPITITVMDNTENETCP